jgi:hypothetical protein
MNFPYINTKNLIKVDSLIKTPTVVTLIDSSDYQIYKKQITERDEYVKQLKQLFVNIPDPRSDEFKFKHHELIRTSRDGYIHINSYALLEGYNTWIKS